MNRGGTARRLWLLLSAALLVVLLAMAVTAPEFLGQGDREIAMLGPLSAPPLGTDTRGVSLLRYAQQGARIVLVPSILAGALVSLLAMVAGVSRCAGLGWLDTALQAASELVGAMPRMVVILVVALAMPAEWRSLVPIALAWAVLAAPGAMDEAATTAGRLGGDKFVEALRAHGFSAWRIYVVHVVWMNLRSVVIRQGAEVGMQVVFLEIALSYLAASRHEPSFTHAENLNSWASLLYDGYTALVGGVPMLHALALGLALVAAVAMLAQGLRLAARAR
jgi:ABC-type dipeptide/oligopeptide/nickel transport system permease subunit